VSKATEMWLAIYLRLSGVTSGMPNYRLAITGRHIALSPFFKKQAWPADRAWLQNARARPLCQSRWDL